MARELNIRITADNSDANTKLADTEGKIGGLDKTVKTQEANFRRLGAAIGSAFSVAAISRMTGEATRAAGQINDLAAKMGIGTAAVQELQFAFEQNGGTIQQAGQALALMGDRLVTGDKSVVGSLNALGLSLDTIRAKSPDQAFTDIATAISRVEDPMTRSKLAMDLFGKSGADMLPVLTSDIAGLRQQAIDMGIVMEDSLIKKGDELGDSWEAMQGRVEAARNKALLPVMSTFLELPGPIQTVIGVASEFSGVLSGLAIAIMAAGGPVAALSGIGSALGTVGTVIAGFISGPVGWITLAIAGLTAIWFTWGDDITRIVSETFAAIKLWLWDKFEPILTPIGGLLESLGEMFAAFRDLVGAVLKKIIDVHIEMVQTVTMWLVQRLQPIFAPLGRAIETIVGVMLRVKNAVVTYAQQLFTGVKTWLVDRFTSIVDGIKGKIDAVTGFFRAMQDAVTGHSYVPDMVTAIGEWFGKLDGLMVAPARSATDDTMQVFSDLREGVTREIDTMVGNIASALGGALTGATSWKDAFTSIFRSAIDALVSMADFLIEHFINKLLRAGLEKILDMLTFRGPTTTIGGLPPVVIGGGGVGGGDGDAPPMFADGGVVTRATLGWTGEAGPEAIIPLERLHEFTGDAGRASSVVQVTVHVSAWDGPSVDDWLRRGGSRKLAEAVTPKLPAAQRRWRMA